VYGKYQFLILKQFGRAIRPSKIVREREREHKITVLQNTDEDRGLEKRNETSMIKTCRCW
jgi:hypothetical protein